MPVSMQMVVVDSSYVSANASELQVSIGASVRMQCRVAPDNCEPRANFTWHLAKRSRYYSAGDNQRNGNGTASSTMRLASSSSLNGTLNLYGSYELLDYTHLICVAEHPLLNKQHPLQRAIRIRLKCEHEHIFLFQFLFI